MDCDALRGTSSRSRHCKRASDCWLASPQIYRASTGGASSPARPKERATILTYSTGSWIAFSHLSSASACSKLRGDPWRMGGLRCQPLLLHTRRARERVKQYTSAVLASLLRRRPLLVVRADRSDHPTAHSRISTAQMAAQSGFSDRPKSLMRLSARLMWPRKM